MSQYGALDLDDSPRTCVFRAIDTMLRSDPTIQQIVQGVGSFRSWRGEASDKKDFAEAQCPAIRITPMPMPESYWYPGATKGTLTVKLELRTKGLAIDDVDNFHFAVMSVLVPRGATGAAVQAQIQTLVDAGAMTGLVTFDQPAFDAQPGIGDEGYFIATGSFSLEVQASPRKP